MSGLLSGLPHISSGLGVRVSVPQLTDAPSGKVHLGAEGVLLGCCSDMLRCGGAALTSFTDKVLITQGVQVCAINGAEESQDPGPRDSQSFPSVSRTPVSPAFPRHAGALQIWSLEMNLLPELCGAGEE